MVETFDYPENGGMGGVHPRSTLIAYFYGGRGTNGISGIHSRLFQVLTGAIPDPEASADDPDGWWYVRTFFPTSPASRDTTIVRLAMNASGPPSEAWRSLRDHLGLLLGDLAIDTIWGYTLLYQAAIPSGPNIDDALNDVLSGVHRLDSSEPLEPLTVADVPGGRLWLVEIPTQGHGAAAATVYVALGPASDQDKLVLHLQDGPQSVIVMPDLIAHKAYFQIRDVRIGDIGRWVTERTAALQTATDQILTAGRSYPPYQTALNDLARNHDALSRVVPRLIDTRVSLLKQAHNFSWWQDALGENAVLSYHRRQIDSAALEIALTVEAVRSTLDTAGNAVAVAQLQVDRDQEHVQRTLTRRVEVVAIALAILQFIDSRVVAELVYRTGWLVPTRSLDPKVPETGYNGWLLLGIRMVVVIALVIGVLVLLKGVLILNRRLATARE